MDELPRLEDTGTVRVGDHEFKRLALGAMRLLSSNAVVDGKTYECYADPVDPEANCELMRAAVRECGIGYVDFARGYGARPDEGERLFREWMEPYWNEVLWGTKVGYTRDQAGHWVLDLSPRFVQDEIDACLRLLGRPIPLLYLTAGSTDDVTIRNRQTGVLDSFQPLLESHKRGEVNHLGVANVTASELKILLDSAPISIVQNKFTVASLLDPAKREVLELCARHNIPFVAWGIFQSDDESPWVPGERLMQAARDLSMSPQDASIAILLHSSPNLVALSGVSRRKSLALSVRAANSKIPAEIVKRFQPEAS